MTIVPMKTSNPAGINVSVSEIVRSFWKAWEFRNHQRKSVRHLRSMPDHILKDLGIHRAEIRSVVYGKTAERTRYDGVK